MKKIINVIGVFALFMYAGCTHNLEVKGFDRYHTGKHDHSFKDVKVVVLIDDTKHTRKETEELSPIAQKVQDALAKQGGYSVSVLRGMPRNPAADVIVKLGVSNLNKSASGSNFFVCWPGFIIFTHAWLGYGYKFELVTVGDVILASDNTSLGKVSVPLNLCVRYADFETTVLNGITWFEWSILGAVNGIIQMSNYDDDFEDELHARVYPIYASQIADGIIEIINRQPWVMDNNATSY